MDQLQCDISNSDNRLNKDSRSNSLIKVNEQKTNYSIIKERIGFDASKMLNNNYDPYSRENLNNKHLTTNRSDQDDDSKIMSHDSELSKYFNKSNNSNSNRSIILNQSNYFSSPKTKKSK